MMDSNLFINHVVLDVNALDYGGSQSFGRRINVEQLDYVKNLLAIGQC
jgi:hypothetical protein